MLSANVKFALNTQCKLFKTLKLDADLCALQYIHFNLTPITIWPFFNTKPSIQHFNTLFTHELR